MGQDGNEAEGCPLLADFSPIQLNKIKPIENDFISAIPRMRDIIRVLNRTCGGFEEGKWLCGEQKLLQWTGFS